MSVCVGGGGEGACAVCVCGGCLCGGACVSAYTLYMCVCVAHMMGM